MGSDLGQTFEKTEKSDLSTLCTNLIFLGDAALCPHTPTVGTATDVALPCTIYRRICGRDQKWKNGINGI